MRGCGVAIAQVSMKSSSGGRPIRLLRSVESDDRGLRVKAKRTRTGRTATSGIRAVDGPPSSSIEFIYGHAHPDYGAGRQLEAAGIDGSYFYKRCRETVIPNGRRLAEGASSQPEGRVLADQHRVGVRGLPRDRAGRPPRNHRTRASSGITRDRGVGRRRRCRRPRRRQGGVRELGQRRVSTPRPFGLPASKPCSSRASTPTERF